MQKKRGDECRRKEARYAECRRKEARLVKTVVQRDSCRRSFEMNRREALGGTAHSHPRLSRTFDTFGDGKATKITFGGCRGSTLTKTVDLFVTFAFRKMADTVELQGLVLKTLEAQGVLATMRASLRAAVYW